jgi:hypothetical protein
MLMRQHEQRVNCIHIFSVKLFYFCIVLHTTEHFKLALKMSLELRALATPSQRHVHRLQTEAAASEAYMQNHSRACCEQ